MERADRQTDEGECVVYLFMVKGATYTEGEKRISTVDNNLLLHYQIFDHLHKLWLVSTLKMYGRRKSMGLVGP